MLTLTASAARADRLVFVNPPPEVSLGGVSRSFALERQLDTGAPITTGTLMVTLASGSGRGQFSADPSVAAPWSAVLAVSIAAGQSSSALLHYRDGSPGTPTLTAQATAFTSAMAIVPIGTRIVFDPVETGTLYVTDLPAGAWNTNWLPEPTNVLAASGPAAHRGSWGLRLDDVVGTNGAGGQNAVFFDTAPMVGDLYVRTWMRVTLGNNLGNIVVAQLTTGGAISPSLIDLELDIPTRQLQIAGFDNLPSYFQENADAGFVPGTWQLLEFAVLGVGTDAGARRVWLDGQPVYALNGVAWSGGSYDVGRVALGEPYSGDRRFKGQLDFDDTLAAALPLASRLVLTPPVDAVAGGCSPVAIALFSSGGAGPIASPYAFTGSLTSTGDAGPYRDAACLMATTNFSLGAGSSGAQVFVKADAPATVQLKATFVDYLPASVTFSVAPSDAGTPDGGPDDAGTPDAGAPDGGAPDAGATDAGPVDAGPASDGGGPAEPLRLGVGCACDSVELGPLGFGLLLLGGRRRQRRTSPRSTNAPSTITT